MAELSCPAFSVKLLFVLGRPPGGGRGGDIRFFSLVDGALRSPPHSTARDTDPGLYGNPKNTLPEEVGVPPRRSPSGFKDSVARHGNALPWHGVAVAVAGGVMEQI